MWAARLANFRYGRAKPYARAKKASARKRRCLAPQPCKNLICDQSEYVELLEKVAAVPKIKKVFVRSGVRFDYAVYDKDETFIDILAKKHVSGQLKTAPEHISNNVLRYMGKPEISVYERFCDKYFAACKRAGLEQYIVPYLMSSHPGSTLDDAIDLALYLKKHKIRPEQVQDFYPTPGTAATTMYYTGLDPFTMQPVKVTRDYEEKLMQRALLQSTRPENAELVRKAIVLSGREDAWQLLGHRPEFRDKGTESKAFGTKGQKTHGRNDRSAKSDKNGRKPGKDSFGKFEKKKKNAGFGAKPQKKDGAKRTARRPSKKSP